MSGVTLTPDLSLTPDQEGLLRTALASNKPITATNRLNGSPMNHNYSTSDSQGDNMHASPTQSAPDSGQLGGQNESPFLAYNLEDGDFDWDNATGEQLFGDLPVLDNREENEHHDKRKASDEEDKEEEGSTKRREGDDKSAKKPGRKPLTAEPTTKRKAQNRAAQRAFRERKERHLKDLETKVEDLEKASETANHENGRLRAEVEKLNVELREYRKRLSLNNTGLNNSPPQTSTRSYYDNGGNDFSFAFPKFGDLPGSFLNNGSIAKTTSPTTSNQRSASTSSTNLPAAGRKDTSNSATDHSPIQVNGAAAPLDLERPYATPNDNFAEELSALFSPAILENAKVTDYVSYPRDKSTTSSKVNQSGSMSNTNGQSSTSNIRQNSASSMTNSPASTISHALDSSTGTTPESSADSPDNRGRSESALDTINEETRTQLENGVSSKSPATDVNGFNWMAQQNDGLFDPLLFSDYRDPQESYMNSAFGELFNEAVSAQDFTTPYNTGDLNDITKHKSVQENGSQKDADMAKDGGPQYMDCDKLWPRVKNSDKVQSGKIDIEELCGELKTKAKCSGRGAVIDEKEVDALCGPESLKPMEDHDDFLSMFK